MLTKLHLAFPGLLLRTKPTKRPMSVEGVLLHDNKYNNLWTQENLRRPFRNYTNLTFWGISLQINTSIIKTAV